MSATPADKAKMLTAEAVKSVGQLSLESIAIASVALVKAKMSAKGKPRLDENGIWRDFYNWTQKEKALFLACKDAGLI